MPRPSLARRGWRGAELAVRAFWISIYGLDDRLEDFLDILESYRKKLREDGVQPWEETRSRYYEPG